jgi:ribonuclease J
VHVSGHGNQEDLKLMLNLVRPSYILPVHGEDRHFARYVELAGEMGYERDSIIGMGVGDILEISKEEAAITGKVERSGNIMVDGVGVGDVSDVVLRDRWHLAQDGIMVVVLTIEQSTGKVIAGPDIVSRGFAVPEHEEELTEEAKGVVLAKIEDMEPDEVSEWASVKAGVRSALGKFIYERTHRRFRKAGRNLEGSGALSLHHFRENPIRYAYPFARDILRTLSIGRKKVNLKSAGSSSQTCHSGNEP